MGCLQKEAPEGEKMRRAATDTSLPEMIRAARLAKAKEQRKKLELENAQLAGVLVPVEEFRRPVLRGNHAVKNLMLGLPAKLAVRFSAMDNADEIAAILLHEIATVCKDLYAFDDSDVHRGDL